MTTNLKLAERSLVPPIGTDGPDYAEAVNDALEEIENVTIVNLGSWGLDEDDLTGDVNTPIGQAAINYVFAKGGGFVKIPPGTYVGRRSAPGQAYIWQVKSGVHVTGDGKTTSTVKLADNQVDFIRPFSFAPGAVGVGVSDLGIHGNRDNNPSTAEHQAGIYVDYGVDALIERVEIQEMAGDGIAIGTSNIGLGRPVNPTVRDVVIHHVTRVGIHAQYYQHATIQGARVYGLVGETCIKGEIDNELGAVGGEGLTITECKFEGDATIGTYGVLLSGASLTTPIQDVVVMANQFYDLLGGVSIGIASHGWVVAGNLFERCQTAVRMSSYSTIYGYVGHVGVTVSTNTVRNALESDSAKAQIELSNCLDFAVVGNSVQGATATKGYALQHCKNGIFQGNTADCQGTTPTGAHLYRSQNVTFSGFNAYVPGGTGVLVSDDGTYPNANLYVGEVHITGPCATGVNVAGATAGAVTLGTVSAPGATANIVAGYSAAKGSTDFRVRVPIIATANLPTAGANRDGTLIIEDAGAGDRNLILYSNGQRFRIDGGAAF